MAADIWLLKQFDFVLWRVGDATVPPVLILGQLTPGAPNVFTQTNRLGLSLVPGFDDLWSIPAVNCGLLEDAVYHYWFEVTVSHPDQPAVRLWITDPIATTVDWRLIAPRVDPPFGDADRYPAAVVKYANGQLITVDLDGNAYSAPAGPSLAGLPANNRLVIYELPTTWTRSTEVGGRDMGVGTFRDVLALFDANVGGENFADLDVTRLGSAYLVDLGINALELLPPADSVYDRQWGYGTTNYCAPDFELGFPLTYSYPAGNRDLGNLVNTCHDRGVRFFVDVVMAFAKNNPYLAAACDDFFILDPTETSTDPDANNSRGSGLRDGYGASLFRYARSVAGYDPVSGLQTAVLFPARQLMKAALTRWMRDFGVDGLRLDSVENVQNWDFVGEYRDHARSLNRARFAANGATGADERFLVVGEELSEPQGLITTERLDGLWHESFKRYIRAAVVGRPSALARGGAGQRPGRTEFRVDGAQGNRRAALWLQRSLAGGALSHVARRRRNG